MNILALNCGGSSIKLKVIAMPEELIVLSGSVDAVGTAACNFSYLEPGREKIIELIPSAGYEESFTKLLNILKPYKLAAVGHRVVHGGLEITEPTIIDEGVLNVLKKCSDLAPLHNPVNIMGIELMTSALPGVPQVAVCDNTFHRTLPPKAYLYGLPYSYYQSYGIRRYGFHGISFSYMVNRAAEILKSSLNSLRIVSLMLGSGTTANAFCCGHSVDVSTGFTPTEGLLQSTRCGDLDPGAMLFLLREQDVSADELHEIVNRKSGWLGLSGVASDYRVVEKQASEGNFRARQAIEVLVYQAKKYIGAYAAAMGGLDVLLFSGGVGENSHRLREAICAEMEFLGIMLDDSYNKKALGDSIISAPESPVKILMVHTDEETIIARETSKVLQNEKIEV